MNLTIEEANYKKLIYDAGTGTLDKRKAIFGQKGNNINQVNP